MSREAWEILQNMDVEDTDMQLAMQCAPLITGLKPSNLLNLPGADYSEVEKTVKNSRLSYYPISVTLERTMLLLYHREGLESYLNREEVRDFLEKMGYEGNGLDEVLVCFCQRYQEYLEKKRDFPHEMGILLGYPIEDVIGFMENKGHNCLFTGYWKVYHDQAAKRKLFERFEYAKESLIQLLHYGMSMSEIMEICVNA